MTAEERKVFIREYVMRAEIAWNTDTSTCTTEDAIKSAISCADELDRYEKEREW